MKNPNRVSEFLSLTCTLQDHFVDAEFMEMKLKLTANKSVTVSHGILVKSTKGVKVSEEDFKDLDPMLVLMEFVRLSSFHPTSLAEDCDAVPCQEFKRALSVSSTMDIII